MIYWGLIVDVSISKDVNSSLTDAEITALHDSIQSLYGVNPSEYTADISYSTSGVLNISLTDNKTIGKFKPEWVSSLRWCVEWNGRNVIQSSWITRKWY